MPGLLQRRCCPLQGVAGDSQYHEHQSTQRCAGTPINSSHVHLPLPRWPDDAGSVVDATVREPQRVMVVTFFGSGGVSPGRTHIGAAKSAFGRRNGGRVATWVRSRRIDAGTEPPLMPRVGRCPLSGRGFHPGRHQRCFARSRSAPHSCSCEARRHWSPTCAHGRLARTPRRFAPTVLSVEAALRRR